MKQQDWLKILNATKKKYESGVTETPEYNAWIAMKQRCYNPKDISYRNYGGRGIRVCSGIQADETRCLVDWIKDSPVCLATVQRRIYKMGWDAKAALFTPADPVKSRASIKRQIAARGADSR